MSWQSASRAVAIDLSFLRILQLILKPKFGAWGRQDEEEHTSGRDRESFIGSSKSTKTYIRLYTQIYTVFIHNSPVFSHIHTHTQFYSKNILEKIKRLHTLPYPYNIFPSPPRKHHICIWIVTATVATATLNWSGAAMTPGLLRSTICTSSL